MSEEVEVVEELSDKEMNFKALREKAEALEARIAELSPLAVEKAVRSAGFDPDTPEGRALSRLAAEDADAEKVKNLAEELGFDIPEPKAELSKNERAAQEFATRAADLAAATSSAGPSGDEQAIRDAETAGDWGLSARLKLQHFLASNQ